MLGEIDEEIAANGLLVNIQDPLFLCADFKSLHRKRFKKKIIRP